MIRYAKYGAISYGSNSALCCVKSFAIDWCGSVKTVNKVWYSYVPYCIIITEPYRSVLNRTVSYHIVPYLSYSFVMFLQRLPYCIGPYLPYRIALYLLLRIAPNRTVLNVPNRTEFTYWYLNVLTVSNHAVLADCRTGLFRNNLRHRTYMYSVE